MNPDCHFLYNIGYYMLMILLLSTIFNSLGIWIFYKAKLYTSTNMFLTTLFTLNLIATFIEAPYMIYNSYNCRQVSTIKAIKFFILIYFRTIKNNFECILNGYTMFFVGNIQTYLLVAISIER